MKPVVVDTNYLIDFCRSPAGFKRSEIGKYDQVIVPSIVLGEYAAGIQKTKHGEEARAWLAQFLSRSSVKTVPIGEKTAEIYGKVFQSLRAQGRPIPQNDIWIAASALEHGADLATTDDHFRAVPLLTVLVHRRGGES